MDNDATLANSPLQTRQKRVLPSRSRRGGPGVGNCEVDNMILNAQLHKSENEPLIPADTMFVLKTNDMLEQVASQFASAEGSGLNLRAHESYFDRPDVLKAYREQTIIETPQYEGVSDTASVGGRLRQRSVEENNSDIDAVYEKRHRKYEAFEKRQRLREKEKLKHEQYKLKERIEQLRGMDNSAFLAAPASSFSPRPGGAAEVFEEDTLLAALGGLGGPNGSPAYQEGERRRKEMLKNAQALEERYRVLLPPERPRKPAGVNVSTDAESELSAKEVIRSHGDAGSEPEEEYIAPVQKKEPPKIKLKIPPRPSITPTATIPKGASTSKKRRRSLPPPFHPPPPPLPPPSRQSRIILAAPSVMVNRISSMGDPGPSSSLERQPNVGPTPDTSISYPESDEGEDLEIVLYDPEADHHRPLKRQRGPSQHKRAKTEDRRVPSPARDLSVLPPDMYIVVDDDLLSNQLSSPPVQEAPLSYSYPPPPPPPPPPEDDYRPSPETSVPPHVSGTPEPVSPLESPSEPTEYPSARRASSPPADEPFVFANSSVPPAEPLEMDRKASVPPIESISASKPTKPVKPIKAAVPTRRGPSRGTVPAKPPRKPAQRRGATVHLIAASARPGKNPRRHNLAFGCKLPDIIGGGDSYDFELPADVLNKSTEKEAEGSSPGPEDSDEGEDDEGGDDDDQPESEDDEDRNMERAHDHTNDDADQDYDGTDP